MRKLCAIISGGEADDLAGIRDADFIIACDRGYAYAKKAAIRPDLLVGDFDSYRGELDKTVPVLDLPVEKDDTDTMAAVRWAVSEGFSEIRLYCALGGRLDHLMGNLQALGFACERGVKASLLGNDARIFLLKNDSITLPPLPGYSLSVLALSDRVENVCISGVKYPLQGARVTNTFPIGISNEWEGAAKISCADGILLVINAKK